MDEEAIIDFAFNFFKSFVYSSSYFISLSAKNFVKIWLCAAVEAETFPFSKKNFIRLYCNKGGCLLAMDFCPSSYGSHSATLCQ